MLGITHAFFKKMIVRRWKEPDSDTRTQSADSAAVTTSAPKIRNVPFEPIDKRN